MFLYEKEGTGFWVLGTGSLKRQLFHASLCPSGHGCYKKAPLNKEGFSCFVVGKPGPKYGLPVAVYKKVLANLPDFHASLWASRGQNTVCPWQL